MTEEYSYNITTRKLKSGKVISKISENGVPISIRGDNIVPAYLSLYKAIIGAHEQAIREGKLEEITTEFKSNTRAQFF